MSKPEYHFLISIEEYLSAAREVLQILPSGVEALKRACDAGEMGDPLALDKAAQQVVPHLHALHLCFHSLNVSMAKLNQALAADVVDRLNASVAELETSQHLAAAAADGASQRI